MSRTVEMVESRPVRVAFGCGQWVCQVAGAAEDLEPSVGRGRVRPRVGGASVGDCVLKRVKAIDELVDE